MSGIVASAASSSAEAWNDWVQLFCFRFAIAFAKLSIRVSLSGVIVVVLRYWPLSRLS